jgi:hypothetical protein
MKRPWQTWPMSLALRYGTSGALFLATVLLASALFLPIERVDYTSQEQRLQDSAFAGAWSIDGGLPLPDGNRTKAATWWSEDFSGVKGITMLRFAAPLLLVGLLVLLVCAFTVLGGRGVATGWAATTGLLIGGVGMVFLLVGISWFAKSITPINDVLDSGIVPQVGFWAMFIGLLVGCGGALAAFNVKPEPKGRIGPDGEPLPPLPVLSVENPHAFNPMASHDPRPFLQKDYEYKTFEVTGGRKTFKEKPKEEAESWGELEAGTEPAAKPAQAKPPEKAKPAKAEPARPEAKPAPKPEDKPAPPPESKPTAKPESKAAQPAKEPKADAAKPDAKKAQQKSDAKKGE